MDFSARNKNINFSLITGQRSTRELWPGFWPPFRPLFSTHDSVILDQAGEEIFKIESRTVPTFITFNLCRRRTAFSRLSLSVLLQFREPSQNQTKVMENRVSLQGRYGKTPFKGRGRGESRLLGRLWSPSSNWPRQLPTVTECRPHCISSWEATVLPSAGDGGSSYYHPCGFKALMCTPRMWAHSRSQLALCPQ